MTNLLINKNRYIVILNSENKILLIPNDNIKLEVKIKQNIDKLLKYTTFEINGIEYLISKYYVDKKVTLFLLESDIKPLVYKDFLTDMYNRNYWEMIKNDKNYDNNILIFIDIDNLKEINDYHGHFMGDKVIVTTSNAITKNINKTDVAIHYSGDEFIVILKDNNKDNAQKIIKRIRDELYRISNDINLKMDICAGIGECKNNIRLDTTLNEADFKMYKEKKRKKIKR